jgi:replicative DNA helicase
MSTSVKEKISLTTETKFPFSRKFQRRILRAFIADRDFFPRIYAAIHPTYFEDVEATTLCQFISLFFEKYGRPPSRMVLQEEIYTHKDRDQLLAYWRKLPERSEDHDILVEKTIEFCKRQAVLRALIEGAKTARNGNISATIRLVEQASQIGVSNTTGIVVTNTEEVDKRIARRLMSGEETIYPLLPDSHKYFLHGGMRKKELWTWLAATGVGKSMSLVHCGRAALIGHWNVLHYTVEMTADEIVDRYDTAMTGIPLGELAQKPDKFKNRLLSFRDTVMGTSCQLIVKEFPTSSASVSDLESHMLMLQHQQGFFADVVLVDYADVLVSERQYKDPRFEREHIFQQLKRLATKSNVLVWTATQADRKSMSKNIVNLDNVNESLGAARISDGVLAICQNQKEQKKHLARIFIAKNRKRRSKAVIPVYQDLDRLIVFGEVKNGNDKKRMVE